MNQVSEAEVTILKNKLDEFETAMAESSKTIAKLEENLFGKQEELAEMVSSVEQMKVIELERKELVVVLQEKEEVEAGLRRQVAELQEMLQEQGSDCKRGCWSFLRLVAQFFHCCCFGFRSCSLFSSST